MAIDVIITPGTGEIKWVDGDGTPQNIRIRGESQNELYFTSDNYYTQTNYYAYSDINGTLGTTMAPMAVFQDSTTGAVFAPGYDHGFSLGAATHRWRGYFSAVSVAGDLVVSQLSAPATLTVTPQGTGGSTSYSYRVTAVSTVGETTTTQGTTSVGNATLSVTNYNRLEWDPVNGAISYKVYGRTSGNELLLATISANNLSYQTATKYFYNDTTNTAGSGAYPTTNTTGSVTIGSALTVPSGGTGATTFTSNGVLYGNGTSALQATAASGSVGAVLATATAGGAPAFTTTLVGTYVISPAASSSGAPSPVLTITSPAHTSITAATEYTGVNFNLATTVTFLAGIIPTQRFVRFQQPTIAFTTSGTATLASTVTIEGAPRAGTGASLPDTVALHVQTGTAAGMGVLITGTTSQTGDYLEVMLAGTALLRFTAAHRLTLATDVELYRSGANALSLGDNDSFTVGSGLAVVGLTPSNAYGIRSGNGVYIQQLSPTNTSSANQSLYILGTAHFNITNSEYNDVFIDLNRTVTLNSGNRSLMRAFRVTAPTYAGTTALTVTNAATVQIDSAPAPGSNVTLTETTALRVLTGTTTGKGVVVRGASNQTGVLIEAQDSATTSLFSVSATGTATVGNNLVVQGAKELRLNNSDNTLYTGFKAPAGMTGDMLYTLPSSQTANYFLKTNGSGSLSWDAALSGASTATYVAYYSGASTLTGSSNFVYNGVQLQLSNATSSGGILLGSDALLYRGAADRLQTPDSLRVDAQLGVGVDPNASYAINANGDINIASGSGVLIGGAATAGYYLRGDGARFVGTSIIDSEEIDIFKYTSTSGITGSGWYRIASNTATSGRGNAIIAVGPSGGGESPQATVLNIDRGFQTTLTDLSVAILHRNASYAGGIDKLRVCRNADNHIFVEAFLDNGVTSTDYFTRIINLTQDFIGSWNTVSFTAGSAEVETVTLDLDTDGTSQGIYHSDAKTVSTAGYLALGTAINTSYSVNASSDINVAQGSGFRINGTGTSGYVLRGDGTRFVSSQLAFSDLSGIASVSQGGTGTGSLTQNGVLYGDGTNFIKVATGISNQFFVGVTSGAPKFVTMSGDVSIDNTGTATIGSNKVTLAKFQQIAGYTIIGNTGATAGTATTIPATADGQVLRRASGVLGFGQISLSDGTNAVSGTLGVTNGGTGSNTAFTQGSVVFAGASGIYTQNNNRLFWDNTNFELGINTATPSAFLHVQSNAAATVGALIVGTTSQTADLLELKSSTGTSLAVFTNNGSLWLKPYGTGAGTVNELRFYDLDAATSYFSAFKSPDTMSASYIYTLPNSTPTANQVLTATSVSGTAIALGWSTPSGGPGGSGTVNNGTEGQYAYYPSAGTSVTGSPDFKRTGGRFTAIAQAPEVADATPFFKIASDNAATITDAAISTFFMLASSSTFTGNMIDVRVGATTVFAVTGTGVINSGSNQTRFSNAVRVSGTTSLEDNVTIGTSSPKELRLQSDATYYTALKSGTLAGANRIFTLPTSYGTSGQFLQTDGSGTLSWATATGSGGYATIQDDASSVTQRTTLNFAAGIKAADNSTNTRTDVRVQRVVFLQMAAGYNPVVGADNAIFRVPESPSDGTTVMTFNLRRFTVRVETPSSGTTSVQLEKSAGGAAFTSTPTQMLTASSGSGVSAVSAANALTITGSTSYEFYSGSFVGTVTTGDLLRLDFTAVNATHSNFSISLLMEET